MTQPPIIGIHTTTNTHVFRWTFSNFYRWVQHEAMFFDSCVRDTGLEAVLNKPGEDGRVPSPTIVYVLTRDTPGYAGFLTHTTQHMFLHEEDKTEDTQTVIPAE